MIGTDRVSRAKTKALGILTILSIFLTFGTDVLSICLSVLHQSVGQYEDQIGSLYIHLWTPKTCPSQEQLNLSSDVIAARSHSLPRSLPSG